MNFVHLFKYLTFKNQKYCFFGARVSKMDKPIKSVKDLIGLNQKYFPICYLKNPNWIVKRLLGQWLFS